MRSAVLTLFALEQRENPIDSSYVLCYFVFHNTPEFIIAEIQKANAKLLIACVYTRPFALFHYSFFETLSAFIPLYQHHIVVTDDFNPDLLSPRKPETVINTYAFSIVSTEPTFYLLHTNPSSHTTLDLFLVKHSQ